MLPPVKKKKKIPALKHFLYTVIHSFAHNEDSKSITIKKKIAL